MFGSRSAAANVGLFRDQFNRCFGCATRQVARYGETPERGQPAMREHDQFVGSPSLSKNARFLSRAALINLSNDKTSM